MNWFRIILVASLLSPAAAWADNPTVGTAAAVNPDATGTPPGGETKTLLIGNEVVFKEKINTASKGQTQILFVDQSTLTIAPNSDIVLDEFVYDPATSTGKTTVSLTKGLLRYVGGEISHHGGATITTPTTTLTIRGAVVTASVTTGPDGKPVSSFSLQFGTATATPTGGGTPQTLQPGTTTTVDSSGKVSVNPTSVDTVTADNGQLQGNSDGKSSDVQIAEVTAYGDTGMPGGSAGGTNASGGGTSTGQGGGGTGGTGGGSASGPVTQPDVQGTSPIVDSQGAGSTAPGSTTPETPPPPPPPLGGRYMSTPPPYETSFGDGVENPQSQGFVGGPSGTDNNQGFSDAAISGGRLTFTLNGGVAVDLPIPDGQPAGSFAVTGPNSTPLGTVTGTGFFDPAADSQFFFYQLTGPGGEPDAITLFGGVPSPDHGAIPGGAQASFEAWNITDFKSSVPLLPNNIGSQFTNATISPYLAVFQAGGTVGDSTNGTRSHVISAELDIEGQGANQKSMLVATVGGLFNDDGGYLYQAPFARGVINTGGGNLPLYLNSGLGTVPGGNATATTGGDQFFGPELNYFVLDNNDGPDDNGAVDTDIGFISDQNFVSQTFGYTLMGSKTDTPATLGTNRSSRTLNGYIANMGQSDIFVGSGLQTPYAVTNLNDLPTDLRITTDTTVNGIVGTFDFGIPAGQSDISSGEINWGGLGRGRDAYLDDQHMASVGSATVAGNLNGTGGLANANQPDGWRPIMISHDLVGTSGLFQAGVTPCTCEFLEWGYWTGQFYWNDPGGPNQSRTDLLNLGTWVAGDLTSVAEVQGLTGSATFNGAVIANVYNAGNQYLAAGSFSSNWNFGSASGTVAINNLDNLNYTGTIATGGGTPGNFSGAISSASTAGTIHGSFFNAPGQPGHYMGGAMTATGSNYRLSGTFTAERAGGIIIP